MTIFFLGVRFYLRFGKTDQQLVRGSQGVNVDKFFVSNIHIWYTTFIVYIVHR